MCASNISVKFFVYDFKTFGNRTGPESFVPAFLQNVKS